MVYKIIRNISSFLLTFKNVFSKNHIINNAGGDKWFFISYIIEPFKRKKGDTYFNGHQNRQEALIIAEVVRELGYSYVYNDYNKFLNFRKRGFEVVFGLEPNFEVMCKKNPKALKIYYATGAYFKHQNSMIINRTNAFSKKYNTNYPYKRLVKEHNSCEIADYIFQIGSKFTIETYPEHLRNKVIIINQTSHVFDDISLGEKIKTFSKKDYIWFGSGGTILKGLDLVIEYFLLNNSLNLHIVGPIEKEFLSVFNSQVETATNISMYGFLDVESNEFRDLANKCTFLIYPSASEGCPGSVINLQKLGVIPILSRWASCDKILELGYQLKDLSLISITDGINWSQALTQVDLVNLIKKNHNFIISTHDTDKFKKEIKGDFDLVLSNYLYPTNIKVNEI